MNEMQPRTLALRGGRSRPKRTAGEQHSPKSMQWWLALFLVAVVGVAWRGLTGAAFYTPTDATARPAADELKSQPRFKRIDGVHPGEKVLATNPLLETQAESLISEIDDPENWRLLRLVMSKSGGGWIDIELLRDLDWLDEYCAEAGETIDLDLAELGAQGPAEVLAIEPCPPIEPGPGRIVTGTFAHSAAHVIDVKLSGDSEPIGCTDYHPFWSEDRQDFVPAGELREGERLRTLSGSAIRVVSLSPRGSPQRVYNLEVDIDHTYFVSTAGVLVHNGCAGRLNDGPIHHIASDKSPHFTQEFQELFSKGGLDLQSKWNKMRLAGHQGPHGDFYHKLVLQRLSDAVAGKSGAAYRDALIKELKSLRRGIRHEGLDALLKARAGGADIWENL